MNKGLRVWSQRAGSNCRPAVYETAALPLSYVGSLSDFTIAIRGFRPISTTILGNGINLYHSAIQLSKGNAITDLYVSRIKTVQTAQ